MEACGVPVAVTVDSAQPHEIKLVEQRLDGYFADDEPERLIGANAYDSEAMDR